ncbi:hypothetical protein IW262DRAFT_1246638, partial [Armillaria fumosa]
DTTTSYCPRAQFSPYAIRSRSRRQLLGPYLWDLSWETNTGRLGSEIIDCGEVPVMPMFNTKAIDQMEVAYTTLINRPTVGAARMSALAKDGVEHPRIITLGGDHTVVILPILRALHKIYCPVFVIHFNHMDTGAIEGWSDQGLITHVSYF